MNLVNLLVDGTQYVEACQDISINVPKDLASVVGTIVNLIKIGVPIILIIFGMLDLGKAVMAQKEDEIKKGQQTFIKRLIAAAIVFFVILIVQLVIGLIADTGGIMDCVNGIINS